MGDCRPASGEGGNGESSKELEERITFMKKDVQDRLVAVSTTYLKISFIERHDYSTSFFIKSACI
jgi:hypothetical protein